MHQLSSKLLCCPIQTLALAAPHLAFCKLLHLAGKAWVGLGDVSGIDGQNCCIASSVTQRAPPAQQQAHNSVSIRMIAPHGL